MVTSRQFGRGVARTMRAMDRAAKQAERSRILRQQALHKQAVLTASAQAAVDYEAMIEALTGAHRISFSRRDWHTTATAPELPAPDRLDTLERAAKAALDEYTPGFFAKTLRTDHKRRRVLAAAVDTARDADDRDHAVRQAAVLEENERIRMARRVVACDDAEVLVSALETHSALGSLPFSIEGLDLRLTDGRVIAVVDGLDLDDMPTELISLLASGKASIKKITPGKRLELHRDAICSAAMRVALEFLSTLPIDEAEVLMHSDILDRGSGHIEGKPVLYLRATVQAVQALILARTDALAIVERLGGHMDWNKRDGFKEISAAAFGLDGG